MSSFHDDEFIEKIHQFFESIPQSVPRIPFEDIPQRGSTTLPSGGNGEAYLSDDKTRAVKILRLGRRVSDKMIDSLHNEIINYHNISTLCPKYFCKFIGYSYDKKNLVAAIVMENCGIDLFEYDNHFIRSKHVKGDAAAFENFQIAKMSLLKMIFYQILEALECLHTNNYAHLDLKSENIVVLDRDGRVEVKFIDAGSLTKIKPGTKAHVYGTPGYMAPELMKTTQVPNTNLLKRMDIYSFGKTCQDLLTRREMICMFSGETIIAKMLSADPEKRPDVSEIMMYMNPELRLSTASNRKMKRPQRRRSSRSRSNHRRRTKSKSPSHP